MKTIMRGLTLAAVLLTGAVTQAEIVIDDFSTSALVDTDGPSPAPSSITDQAIGSGITRSVSVTGSFATAQFDGGPKTFSATLAQNNSMTLSYNLTGAAQRNFFVDQVLRTGFANITGPNLYNIAMVVSSTGFTNAMANWSGVSVSTIGQFNMLKAVSNPGVGNGHLAAFANVNTISFSITQANPTFSVSTFGSTTGIRAVPEPATMSLLGLTAIGGIFAHRRRKNQLAA